MSDVQGLVQKDVDQTGEESGAAGRSSPSPASPATDGIQPSQMFGELVGLMMQSPAHKHLSLIDLEWKLLPALTARQFRVFRMQDEQGNERLIGAAFWAFVSPEVGEKLGSAPRGLLKLRPDEWQCGDELWLVDLVGPPKLHTAMIDELRKTAFAGKSFSMRAVDKEGNILVRQVAPEESGQKVQ